MFGKAADTADRNIEAENAGKNIEKGRNGDSEGSAGKDFAQTKKRRFEFGSKETEMTDFGETRGKDMH